MCNDWKFRENFPVLSGSNPCECTYIFLWLLTKHLEQNVSQLIPDFSHQGFFMWSFLLSNLSLFCLDTHLLIFQKFLPAQFLFLPTCSIKGPRITTGMNYEKYHERIEKTQVSTTTWAHCLRCIRCNYYIDLLNHSEKKSMESFMKRSSTWNILCGSIFPRWISIKNGKVLKE